MKSTQSTQPNLPLPPEAWDCHAHVFGPFDQYPLLKERRYEPPLSPGVAYVRELDTVGFKYGCLVHPSAYGYNNSCTRDALLSSNGRITGVCVVPASSSDGELEALHADGFRAIRITETGARARQFPGALFFEDLQQFAPRLRALGWHAHVYANCHLILEAASDLASYGIPIAFDHMGYFDPSRGVNDPVFQSYLSLLTDGDYWVKLTPIRLSKTDLTYESVRPFHDALLRAIPDRCLFGSDWPYLSMEASATRTVELVNLFDHWTPDPQLRQQILVKNPPRLFKREASLP